MREISEGELREISIVVRKGETVRTAKEGFAILLKGKTVGMRLGGDTTVDTSSGGKTRHSLSLLKGRLNVKIRPSGASEPGRQFRLKMPTTVLAVKGTSFFAEVTDQFESGGVNEGAVEAIRMINGQERKAPVNSGNALVVNGEGSTRMRRLIDGELGYRRIYDALEIALDDKKKARERGFVELVWIPPGSFRAGQTGNRVEITKGFCIGKYEVTQEEYRRITGTSPANFEQAGSSAPVESVAWQDAMDFCNKLTKQDQDNGSLPQRWKYTLPTEAQWEYACRAGSTTAWFFGDDATQLGEYAWFVDNSGATTQPVGQKKPNKWGLYDMSGNVWEMCRDWFGEQEPGGKDPAGPASGENRVNRGGSIRGGSGYCQSSHRNQVRPGTRWGHVGFRVALIFEGSDQAVDQ